jgi:ubiquitin carboxyl-terminal hydrolase 4/11/15
MTVNPSALENLPAYEPHDSNEEGVPLINKAVANAWDSLQTSIEPQDDEAIDLGAGYNAVNISTFYNADNAAWDFAALGRNTRGDQMISGTGSDVDDGASDVVEHDSSASEASVAGRIQDLRDAIPEDEEGTFVDQSPVPDLDEEGQAATIALQADLLENMQSIGRGVPIFQATTQFDVTADDERLEVEEPAAEIHLDDVDDIKLD